MAVLKFTIQYNRDINKAKVTVTSTAYVAEPNVHHVAHVICNVPTWAEFSDGVPRFVMAGVCQDYLLDTSTGKLTLILI